MGQWNAQKVGRDARIAVGGRYAMGKIMPSDTLVGFLESVVRSGDR